jgi:hypothetical protein
MVLVSCSDVSSPLDILREGKLDFVLGVLLGFDV